MHLSSVTANFTAGVRSLAGCSAKIYTVEDQLQSSRPIKQHSYIAPAKITAIILTAHTRVADEGFGVGHTRSTQTKGVWVWGEPQLPAGSNPTQAVPAIIYVDTEGFESTGKSDVYDDRIFALSTIISSLLVYNLPETVRESDVEKLSFAVQLAEGFYASSQARPSLSHAIALWLLLLSDTLLVRYAWCRMPGYCHQGSPRWRKLVIRAPLSCDLVWEHFAAVHVRWCKKTVLTGLMHGATAGGGQGQGSSGAPQHAVADSEGLSGGQDGAADGCRGSGAGAQPLQGR